MKLLYAPGACSLGIHVLLEEVCAPYEAQAIALRDGEQYQPSFVATNPKSKIPTLVRDDGSVLTEYGAIAAWIARCHPGAGLIPNDAEGEARMWEIMDYVVATLHMQGYARMVRPGNFAPSAADHEAVRARGREIFTKALALIDTALTGRAHAAGAAYTLADSALFYACVWARRVEIPLPAHVAAHFAGMQARPAVQRSLAAEGITL